MTDSTAVWTSTREIGQLGHIPTKRVTRHPTRAAPKAHREEYLAAVSTRTSLYSLDAP